MAKQPRARRKTNRAPRGPFPRRHAPAPDFTIVGVGASAGGFEAFAQLLEGLPANPNIAIIFVQHLAPHHSSSLASLLAGHTPLPVVEATEGARIVPNRVYVVPPNAQMELVDGHLHLGRRPDDRSQYNPIDFFFRSLARSLRAHAIGVVLSGTASDGALGIREIKTMEGITFAQDPATAKYDGMPRAAIATQMVDVVGVAGRDRGQGHADLEASVSRAAALKPNADRRSPTSSFVASSGCCCRPAASISRTTRRRRSSAACSGAWRCSAWSTSTRTSPISSRRRWRSSTFTTTCSSTSRDFSASPSRSRSSRATCCRRSTSRRAHRLRMWVAGCATGEEVYSLAIVVREVLGDTLDGRPRADFRNRRQRKRRQLCAPGAVRRVDCRRRLAGAAAAVLRRRPTAATR